MKVKELENKFSERERFVVAELGEIEIDPEEGIKVPNLNDPIVFDEISVQKMSEYLEVNPTYMKKCPPDLQKANLDHWLQVKNDNTQVKFRLIGHHLEGVYNVDKKIFPMEGLVDVVTNVFEPDDEVRSFYADDPDSLHIDVTSDRFKVEVPGLDNDFRPLVGDITEGGLRLLSFKGDKKQAPTLESYLYRLVCANGMTMPEPLHQINLKADSVSGILQEMEEKAQEILGGLEQHLENYRKTSEIPVSGNIEQFIMQLGDEHQIPVRATHRIMSMVPQIPAEPTVYDVTQLFTNVGSDDTVSYRTRSLLQNIGGLFVTNTEHMTNRCRSCQHVLG